MSQQFRPVILQDAETDKVLGLFYWNPEAQKRSQIEQVFYLWDAEKQTVRPTHFQVKSILESDHEWLVKVIENEAKTTIFGEKNTGKASFLNHLKTIVRERKNNPSEASYTSSLFQKGINKCAQKVGEEAVELVIEAMDNHDDLFRNEGADLLYHLLVLTEAKMIDFDELIDVLIERHHR